MLHHDAMPPRGSLVFDVAVDTRASGSALSALAVDLDRYTLVEPRLTHAQWLADGMPQAGARAEVVGDIPFSVALVERVIGHPRGIATLEAFEPPGWLAYRLETARAIGHLTARFTDSTDGCVVAVNGWIVPRQRFVHLALAPIAPLLRQLVDDAVTRGVMRAAAAVAADQGSGPSDDRPGSLDLAPG
jgi:hypothetical protein